MKFNTNNTINGIMEVQITIDGDIVNGDVAINNSSIDYYVVNKTGIGQYDILVNIRMSKIKIRIIPAKPVPTENDIFEIDYFVDDLKKALLIK